MATVKPIIRYVSPKQAIRVALGKLGYANMMQTLELDMMAWVSEAQGLIGVPIKALKKYARTKQTEDSRIAHCPEDTAVACVKIDGKQVNFKEQGSCGTMVTSECRKCCSDSKYSFWVDECYIHISPSVPDGTEAEVTTLQRPKDKEGYPMIPDVTSMATAEYVKWMLCVRENDNRAAASEARWLVLVKIARGLLIRGQWSQAEIEKLGYIWW